MNDATIEIVKDRIRSKHQGDSRQLDVVFSDFDRLLVEAPAGYGKTNTMVSKIAYMIVTGRIPNPKRLLALTFSVNAAYKIKKDVTLQLPALLSNTSFIRDVADKLFVSNYHGFCRSVLKKYGGTIHPKLSRLDEIQSVDDGDTKRVEQAVEGLSFDEAQFMSKYSDAVKSASEDYLTGNFDRYCEILISKLLPKNAISFNGILTLTLLLFRTQPQVLAFYRQYFVAVLVDEYQDTNLLSFWLIKALTTPQTRLILLGDSLQRIYGFIGAVPNLLETSATFFGLQKITLNKNYRFASNQQMLMLDLNIRRNAEDPYNPRIDTSAEVPFEFFESQSDESFGVLKKAVTLQEANQGAKVAILVKQRSPNVDKIVLSFTSNKVPFFYGLFSDEDAKYVAFHVKCVVEFNELRKGSFVLSKRLVAEHVNRIKDFYSVNTDPLITALINLLEIFWDRMFKEFSSFSNDEKLLLAKDTFEHNGLKQYIEFIATNVIISTVHAAKGLEWDFVILPDMEQDSFPSWMSLCGNCAYRSNCNFAVTSTNEAKFLEELSVFYVAVTRARRQVYFIASKTAVDKFDRVWRKNLSCLMNLKGVNISMQEI